ncbi:hypothetical protein XI09_09685 [Bradyrhizobium sp. CCBAU 11386]|nr:hypothetical protein [Bradyrhizobium sp. CCBAU 11386]
MQLRDEHIGVSLTDGGSEQTRALKRSVAFARADVEKLWKISAVEVVLRAIRDVVMRPAPEHHECSTEQQNESDDYLCL